MTRSKWPRPCSAAPAGDRSDPAHAAGAGRDHGHGRGRTGRGDRCRHRAYPGADAGGEAGRSAFRGVPGATPALYAAAHDADLPYLPGAATASDLILGLEHGQDTFKFFPAVQAGGAALLAAWHGPFADVRFCPTGGISAQTAPQFLHLPNVLCVGGSWLTTPALLQTRDWRPSSASPARPRCWPAEPGARIFKGLIVIKAPASCRRHSVGKRTTEIRT